MKKNTKYSGYCFADGEYSRHCFVEKIESKETVTLIETIPKMFLSSDQKTETKNIIEKYGLEFFEKEILKYIYSPKYINSNLFNESVMILQEMIGQKKICDIITNNLQYLIKVMIYTDKWLLIKYDSENKNIEKIILSDYPEGIKIIDSRKNFVETTNKEIKLKKNFCIKIY